MQFEWDDEKAAANERKHGVRFVDAAGVFVDALGVARSDGWDDYGEERWVAIGHVGAGSSMLCLPNGAAPFASFRPEGKSE
jgi:uncharacterized DUF497 family protein